MSELSDFEIFSPEAAEELARKVYSMVPDDVFVTVLCLELDINADIYTMGPGTDDMPSMLVARNERRIGELLDIIEIQPPWHYDVEKYPVLMIAIESARCYYGYVGITLSRELPAEYDSPIIQAVFGYIRKHLPEPFIDDEGGVPDVRYFYGVLSNTNTRYDPSED